MDNEQIGKPFTQELTDDLLESESTAALPHVSWPQAVSAARRRFQLLYYSLGAICIAAMAFLNYSLNTGKCSEQKTAVLCLLTVSILLMLGSSARYERRFVVPPQQLAYEPLIDNPR
jgi:predicted membrane channel-forming protein YqfA (hemolysin III family)